MEDHESKQIFILLEKHLKLINSEIKRITEKRIGLIMISHDSDGSLVAANTEHRFTKYVLERTLDDFSKTNSGSLEEVLKDLPGSEVH